MNISPFASLALWALPHGEWGGPSRCPYCPADSAVHWIGWGHYVRYAVDSEVPDKQIEVPRCRCKITFRTFSLLPDSLLPYHGWRTAHILQLLYAMFVHEFAPTTIARRLGLGRGALRSLRRRFLRAASLLRLPGHEGVLDAGAFMSVLADMDPVAVADLFRDWKEREPKLSLVGIYMRC